MLYHRRTRQKSNEKSALQQKNGAFIKFLLIALCLMAGVTWIETQFFGRTIPPFQPVLNGEMEKWQIVTPPYHPQTALFIDSAGNEVPLSDLKGAWHLVNFWATWCAPCLVELPSLAALDQQFEGQGFDVMAMNMDSGVSQERLNDFIATYAIERIAGTRAAGRSIHKALSLRGLPTTVLIDPTGLMRAVYLGEADWASPEAKAFIVSVLNPQTQAEAIN